MFTLKCRAFLQFESEFECLIIWFIWMHCLYTYFKFAVGKKNTYVLHIKLTLIIGLAAGLVGNFIFMY